MFSTITGIKFKSKKVEDLKEEVHGKLGVDKEAIFIHGEWVGLFNETGSRDTNLYKEYGVPDGHSMKEDEEGDYLDYRNGRIINKKPNFDLPAHIFKHQLCEDEVKIEVEEEIDMKKYVDCIENANEEEKQIICDNMEGIIREIFNKSNK